MFSVPASPLRSALPSCSFPAFFLALLLASGTPARSQSRASGQALPYESLARRVLVDWGAGEAQPETFDLHGFLAGNCLRLSVGLYDLYLPLEVAEDEEAFSDFQRVALALIDSQETWLDWLEPTVPDRRELKSVRGDIKTLRRWVKGWKSRAIDAALSKDAGNEGGQDMFEVLGAKDSLRAAALHFAAYAAEGRALGLERSEGLREPIVLVTDRTRMVQLCCLGGWIYPSARSAFWQGSITTWTHFYIDDVKFLATHLANPRSPGDYAGGVRMDTRTKTGLEEQIVQLATNSLLANYFGDAIPPTLAGGLAINLVVDLYGECNTRVDGDLRARRTSAREVFVPGGNPNGGLLPPNLADSRWRSEQGSDYFVAALRRGMSAGSRKDHLHFTLQDDRGRRGVEVAPPFLGSAAATRSLPGGDYYGDQLEFLRSYRTCFLHWLREHGMGKEKRSHEAFAELLRRLAHGTVATLEATLAEVYGLPLSQAEPGDDDLEGRFLGWLRRQR